MSAFADDPLVRQYFHDIRDSTGVPPETEVELARRIGQGDDDALGQLVQANLRFVVSVAKHYRNLGLPLADLINAGNLGLIVAAKRFDASRGLKFISYAVWWIRQSILQALAEQVRVVRLPANRLGELVRVNKALNDLEQQLGEPPELAQVAAALSLSPDRMAASLELAQHPLSLEARLDRDQPERCLGDSIADDSVPAVDEVMSRRELRSEIKHAVRTLSEVESQIICMYYGLEGREPMALEEIGARFGRTRERVRQIKEKALQKLRHGSRGRTLRDYLAD